MTHAKAQRRRVSIYEIALRLCVKLKFMKDLSNPFWIKLKGLLFLFIGIVATVLLFLDSPTLRTAVLLALAIWSFC